MQLQIQPNSWTCFPTALAMVCGVPLDQVLTLIGHDGSKILYPQYSGPQKRQAFNVLEITDAAYELGFALVTLENQLFIPKGDENISTYYGMQSYANKFLKKHNAILLGELNGSSHAVAFNYERQLIFDPVGTRYECNLFNIESIHIAIPIGIKNGQKVCEEE